MAPGFTRTDVTGGVLPSPPITITSTFAASRMVIFASGDVSTKVYPSSATVGNPSMVTVPR
jgi:hypothetical protein